MMVLRAFRYFVEEALTSLWRSRLITGLSVITIAVSLFVLGAFLSLASNLAGVVARWSDKVQVTFYLEDQLPDAPRDGLQAALRADPAVEAVVYISREEALRRFRGLFREMRQRGVSVETHLRSLYVKIDVGLQITLNGDSVEVVGPLTVIELLSRFAIDPRRVAVEHNLTVLKRAAYADTIVRDGDRVEIVNFVGGG